jgi:carbonic anhydrase
MEIIIIIIIIIHILKFLAAALMSIIFRLRANLVGVPPFLYFKLTKMYWLLGRQSKLTTSSKRLAYKVVLKPIWTYGLQLLGRASTSNIEILERFQSKALRMITDAPWYVTNALLRRDLHIPSVKEEIQQLSFQYSTRLNSHPNLLTANLKK